MVRVALRFCSVIVPALVAIQPVGAKPPERLTLTPDSETALLVVKSEIWDAGPTYFSAFKIGIDRFDPDEGKLSGALFGQTLVEAKKRNYADGYLLTSIKPGRWVVSSYSQQDRWSLCFNAASWQFDVKAGEVVFLGEFDAFRHRAELVEHTKRSGKVTLRQGQFASFFDLPEGPQFKAIDDMQLAAVREMLSRRAPQVSAPVRAVVFSPAQFGTGSSLFGQRTCGGYFKEGVKGKSVPGRDKSN